MFFNVFHQVQLRLQLIVSHSVNKSVILPVSQPVS